MGPQLPRKEKNEKSQSCNQEDLRRLRKENRCQFGKDVRR